MREHDRIVQNARANRRDPGLAEVRLWDELSHRQMGVQFRSQHPIGPFIADFACRSRRIVIEVDDDTHDDPVQEAIRDDYLVSRGWHVVHVADWAVLEATDGVFDIIKRVIEQPDSLPNPVRIEP